MRLLVLIALVVSLAGCAAARQKREAEAFQARMDALIGGSGDEVLREFGVPTSTVALSDGSRIVEYNKRESRTSGGGSYAVPKTVFVNPGNGSPGVWVNTTQQQFTPVTTRTESCKLLFEISPTGIVKTWKAEGNACI